MEKKKITPIIFTVVLCATLVISLYSRVVATEPAPCIVGLPPHLNTEEYSPFGEITCQRCVKDGEPYLRTLPGGYQILVQKMKVEDYTVPANTCRVMANKTCVAKVKNSAYLTPACNDVPATGTN